MEEIVSDSVARQRFSMLFLGVFAGLALVLAAVAIYGVMSYSVAQQTREIGIRMALGAQRSDVLKMTVGQGLRLVSTGVAIGLAAAFILTRVMATLLFGVSPTDPLTFISISIVLIGVACWPATFRRCVPRESIRCLHCVTNKYARVTSVASTVDTTQSCSVKELTIRNLTSALFAIVFGSGPARIF